MICPAGGRRWSIFLARYPASRSFLISLSRTVEAIHLPPAPDPDIFGEPLFGGGDECLGARARAKGNGRAEGRGVGKEEEALSLYRGNKNFCASLLAWWNLFIPHSP